ncbi:DUF6538 domain-containing protein [Jiella pacifica]|uniref:Site-specific integrase n=1 Tax=Jiella pacifica TaxID=2696469 RepID=A0A6N9SXZ7_9HYPH|nr:DUF6538 domain-containing protein [Jiella pacifica]NDW03944.1 site-specific integrase [Jiella pacifica]
MARSSSERFLKRRGDKYQFRREIPVALRDHFDGKTAIIQPLQTSDTKVAKRRRDEFVRETDRLFEEARNGRLSKPMGRVEEIADRWKEEIAAYQNDPIAWSAKAGVVVDREEDVLSPHDVIEYEIESIGTEQGEVAKGRFLDRLHNRTTVEEHVETYLSELDLKPKTIQGRRADILLFAAWATKRGSTVRTIDRRAAADFFAEVLLQMNRKTAETKFSNIKAYWRWLIERDFYLEDSPWERLRFP